MRRTQKAQHLGTAFGLPLLNFGKMGHGADSSAQGGLRPVQLLPPSADDNPLQLLIHGVYLLPFYKICGASHTTSCFDEYKRNVYLVRPSCCYKNINSHTQACSGHNKRTAIAYSSYHNHGSYLVAEAGFEPTTFGL